MLGRMVIPESLPERRPRRVRPSPEWTAMPRSRFPRLPLLSLLAVAALAAAPGAARSAPADTFRVRYGVSLIGLPIGAATISGSVGAADYRVDLSTRLTGLASLLSSSRGAATATGSLQANRVLPATYATTSANAQASRTIRMAMKAGTVEDVDISPPFDPWVTRVPVTAADKRNILDPLSAFVVTVPGTGDTVGPAACNRTVPVFDGATRFDIDLSYVGTRQAQTKGYSGPVAVCAVRYRPIAGHRADGRGTQFMADNRDIEVWLAPVAGTRVVVPFHIGVQTLLGRVVIEAEEFAVDGTGRAVVR